MILRTLNSALPINVHAIPQAAKRDWGDSSSSLSDCRQQQLATSRDFASRKSHLRSGRVTADLHPTVRCSRVPHTHLTSPSEPPSLSFSTPHISPSRLFSKRPRISIASTLARRHLSALSLPIWRSSWVRLSGPARLLYTRRPQSSTSTPPRCCLLPSIVTSKQTLCSSHSRLTLHSVIHLAHLGLQSSTSS